MTSLNYKGINPDTPIYDPKQVAFARANNAVKAEHAILNTEWHESIKDIMTSILDTYPISDVSLWETVLEVSIQGNGDGIKFLSKLVLAMRTLNDVLNFRLAADTVCEDITLRFQDAIETLRKTKNASLTLTMLENMFTMSGDEGGSVFHYNLKPVLTYSPGTFGKWNELRSQNFTKLAEMPPETQVEIREALLKVFAHTRYGGEFLTKGAPTVYPSIEGFLPYSEERVDFEMKHMIDKEKADLENQYKDDDTFGAF